jgi:hypothetical protein
MRYVGWTRFKQYSRALRPVAAGLAVIFFTGAANSGACSRGLKSSYESYLSSTSYSIYKMVLGAKTSCAMMVMGLTSTGSYTAGTESLQCVGRAETTNNIFANSNMSVMNSYSTPGFVMGDFTENDRLTDFSKVVIGKSDWNFFACAIMNSGAIKCWGNDSASPYYLGYDPTTVDSGFYPNPITSTYSGTPTDIAAGNDTACALIGGSVYCWGGTNAMGELGQGNMTAPTAPNQYITPGPVLKDQEDDGTNEGDLTGVTQIAASGTAFCALSNGQVYCWGANTSGQLGRFAAPNNQAYATRVKDGGGAVLSGVTKIVGGGYNHFCALTSSGQVYCWGDNYYGQVGNGGSCGSGFSYSYAVPVTIAGGLTAYDISAGGSNGGTMTGFSCAIAGSSRSLYCWGESWEGRLGVSPTTFGVCTAGSSYATNVPQLATYGGSGMSDIVSGGFHSYAKFNGVWKGFGSNNGYQLNRGSSITSSSTPLKFNYQNPAQ